MITSYSQKHVEIQRLNTVVDAGKPIGRAFYQISDKTNDYLFIGHIEINISINVLVKQKRELKNNYFEMNYFLWEKRII